MTLLALTGIPVSPAYVTIPQRTLDRIELVARTAPLREQVDINDRQQAEALANELEACGLIALANQTRTRAGIAPKRHTHVPRSRTREQKSACIEKVLEIIAERGRIRPDDLALALGRSRSYTDQITTFLRRDGKIVVVAKRFYALAPL